MIGANIVYLDTVDSTNNYAAEELLTKSLKEGTVFAADCQESGRGQGNSSWESAKGLNLTFSVILYPQQVEIVRQFSISQAISLGMWDFLNPLVDQVFIKWPNDIYVGNKKIGGVLIETAIQGGKFSRAIVGIGLNVNQELFVSEAPNPISLKKITGKNYDLSQMLKGLCDRLEKRYEALNRGDLNTIQTDYEAQLYMKDKWATYHTEGSDFLGKIRGVDNDGKLLIETPEGMVRSFWLKEVSFK